jgi:hypothetical protein
MRAIKSALGLGLRPSAHILGLKKPLSGWSESDHKLAVAYSTLEAETCDKCGNPIWLCRTTDERVEFEVKKYRCFATAEIEQREEKWRKQNKKGDRLKPGEYEYAVPKTRSGASLPSREDFYNSFSKD